MTRANNALQARLLQQNESQDLRRIRRTANQGYRQAKRRGDFAAALQFLTQAKDLTGATSNTNRQEADKWAAHGMVQQNRDMGMMAGQASNIGNANQRAEDRRNNGGRDPSSNIGVSRADQNRTRIGSNDSAPSLVDDAGPGRAGLSLEDQNNPMAKHLFGFSSGGEVPGLGDEDTVPAMLTPGETVLTPEQKQLADSGLPVDDALNATGATNGLPPEEDSLVAESEMKTRMFNAGGPVDLTDEERMQLQESRMEERINSGGEQPNQTTPTQPLPQAPAPMQHSDKRTSATMGRNTPGNTYTPEQVKAAYDAGYLGNDGVARFHGDQVAGTAPTAEQVNPAPDPSDNRTWADLAEDSRRNPERGSARNPIRTQGSLEADATAARAQAAIAPGAQQRIAREADNRALVEQGRRTPEGENKTDSWYNRRALEAQQAERQKRIDGTNAPTMNQLSGLPQDVIDRIGWDPDASINDVNIEREKVGLPPIDLEPSAYDIFTKDARKAREAKEAKGRKGQRVNTQKGRGRNQRNKSRARRGR